MRHAAFFLRTLLVACVAPFRVYGIRYIYYPHREYMHHLDSQYFIERGLHSGTDESDDSQDSTPPRAGVEADFIAMGKKVRTPSDVCLYGKKVLVESFPKPSFVCVRPPLLWRDSGLKIVSGKEGRGVRYLLRVAWYLDMVVVVL